MRKTYQKLFTDNPRLHCQILNRTIHKNFVIDLESLTGRENLADFQGIAIYEVKDELIHRVWFIK